MTQPPMPHPRLWDHDEDRDAGIYLYFAARDVYRRYEAALDSEGGPLVKEGVAELRGAVQCLRRFGQLSEASTVELLAALVGEEVIAEWFSKTSRFIEG